MLLCGFVVLAISSTVFAQADPWAQCGGTGWAGPTTCAPGFSCSQMNPSYYQCLSNDGLAANVHSRSWGARQHRRQAPPPAVPAVPSNRFNILAGGYTSQIATFVFDATAKTLKLASQSPSSPNPSWIILHPTNSSILYATSEADAGLLQSFTIAANGALTQASTISSGGSSPAFCVGLSTGEVAIMNFGSGNGMVIPTTADSLRFQPTNLITFPVGAAPAVSQPHMALEHNGTILVPDRSADRIWRLTGTKGAWKVADFITHPAQSGPRHIAIFNEILYTMHEIDNSLTSQVVPAIGQSSKFISSLNIAPIDAPAGAKFAAAEILLPTPNKAFPGTLIYCSNRNIGTFDKRGDAISVFEAKADGSLTLLVQVFTGLDKIRGMEFGGPNGMYLVAASSGPAGGLAVFERINAGRDLQVVARSTELQSASSFVWA